MRLNLISLFFLFCAVLSVRSIPLPIVTTKAKHGDLTDAALSSPGPTSSRPPQHSEEERSPVDKHGSPFQIEPIPPSHGQALLSSYTQAMPTNSRSLVARFFKDGGWKFWNKNKQTTTLQPPIKPIEVHVQVESNKFGKIVRTPAISRPARFPQSQGKGKAAVRVKPLPTPPKRPLQRPAVHPQGPRGINAHENH